MKRILIAVAIASVATLPLVGYRSPKPVKSRAEGVWICHFPGHQGPRTGDFVTFNAPPRTTTCNAEDGEPLFVSPMGCINGHHAINRHGKDCFTEDQD